MHPIYHDELSKARIADLHRRAERVRLARACAQARHARKEHRKDRWAAQPQVFARRLLIIRGTRSA